MAVAYGPGGVPAHPERAERRAAAEDRSPGRIPRLVLPGAGLLLRRARPRPRSILGADRLLLRPQRRRRDRAATELEGVALLRQPLHRTGRGGRRRRRLG